MKKLIAIALVLTAFILSTNNVNAQSKIGYISTQELIQLMPEYKKADSAMGDYQSALNDQYITLVQEYRGKDSVYNILKAKLTPAQQEIKEQEITQLYQRVQSWQQEAQQRNQQKQQELMKPIYDKAMKAINDVAKENGFSYVFNKEQLLVSPPGEDILPLVKKKLGLK